MKKLNKICLKKRYWGYCFRCNQENKLQELILRAYPDIIWRYHWWVLSIRQKELGEINYE